MTKKGNNMRLTIPEGNWAILLIFKGRSTLELCNIRSHVWRKNLHQKDTSKRDYFMCSKIAVLVGSIDNIFGVWGGA